MSTEVAITFLKMYIGNFSFMYWSTRNASVVDGDIL